MSENEEQKMEMARTVTFINTETKKEEGTFKRGDTMNAKAMRVTDPCVAETNLANDFQLSSPKNKYIDANAHNFFQTMSPRDQPTANPYIHCE